MLSMNGGIRRALKEEVTGFQAIGVLEGLLRLLLIITTSGSPENPLINPSMKKLLMEYKVMEFKSEVCILTVMEDAWGFRFFASSSNFLRSI